MADMQPANGHVHNDSGLLDQIIERIETTLPQIHRLCKVRKKQKKTAPEHLEDDDEIEVDEKCRARFQELSEDPIINSSGTEITDDPLEKINGAHDHQKRDSA